MRKVIVYFHGFGSSPDSDKVERLKVSGAEVFAYPIDVDPRVSIPSLEHNIDMMLLDDVNRDMDLTFVGTSLGGWYAGVLGAKYACKRVLINPCIDLQNSLLKYALSSEVLVQYKALELTPHAKYHISIHDEVINFAPYMNELAKFDTTFYDTTGHRFNGPEFDVLAKTL